MKTKLVSKTWKKPFLLIKKFYILPKNIINRKTAEKRIISLYFCIIKHFLLKIWLINKDVFCFLIPNQKTNKEEEKQARKGCSIDKKTF